MLEEILKITPRLENKDLNKMERGLNSRFMRIAKRFGKGITQALSFGGKFALVAAAIDRILNPLKEVQEAIEKTLNQADELNTNAEQFNTTPGNLFKLRTFGKATGLQPEQLDMMLVKFQTAIAKAKANPNEPSAVRQFVDIPDIAEGLFQYVQALNKLEKTDPTKAVIAQRDTFGEKLTLKMAEFMRSDFEKLNRRLGLYSSSSYTERIKSTGRLADVKEQGMAALEAQDFLDKSSRINLDTVKKELFFEQKKTGQENKDLSNYDNLAKLQSMSDGLTYQLRELNRFMGFIIAEITKYLASRAARQKGSGD